MRELTLEEIKTIEFNILKVFDAFCKEYNIKYYLSNGTLLGAVKYKGFIPWDDDIDVLIPRDDYNRLIATFKDDERYKLFAFEKNPDFLFPFCKLCDMTTRKIEPSDNGVELGLNIDIFPLDYWESDLRKATREAKRINRLMFALSLTKMNRSASSSFVKRMLKNCLILLCKIIGSKYFIRKIQCISIKSKIKNHIFLGCKSWCIYGEREIIPAEVFSDIVRVDFEGEKFPVPTGFDRYLRKLYGAYEKDPPIEKQKTHHSFKAYSVL